MSKPIEIRLRLEDERSLPVLLKGQAAAEVRLHDNGDGTYGIGDTVEVGAIRDAGAVPGTDVVVEAMNAMIDELWDLRDDRVYDIVGRAVKRVQEYTGKPDREGLEGGTPPDGYPDKARKAWEAGMRPDHKVVIEAILDAQAELQTGLGLMRLLLSPGEEPYSDSELIPRVRALDQGYFAKSLAWLHAVLDAVGKPMYDPATHPDVPATLARDDD